LPPVLASPATLPFSLIRHERYLCGTPPPPVVNQRGKRGSTRLLPNSFSAVCLSVGAVTSVDATPFGLAASSPAYISAALQIYLQSAISPRARERISPSNNPNDHVAQASHLARESGSHRGKCPRTAHNKRYAAAPGRSWGKCPVRYHSRTGSPPTHAVGPRQYLTSRARADLTVAKYP
jgi:hypothetical protein